MSSERWSHTSCVKRTETFLSPSVKSLLVDLREECFTSPSPKNAVTPELTLNWEVISELLAPALSGGELDQQGYINVCRELWPVFRECGTKVQNAKSPPDKYWQWTSCLKDIQACFLQLQAPEIITPVRVTLLLSALFENSLGNVYLTRNSNVPFLLRDLLISKELLNVFGTVPILVARVLIGSPLALNVRNLCWHGFAAPMEIHLNIAAALLVLVTSFGEILWSTSFIVPYRSKVDKDAWLPFIPHFQSIGLPSANAMVVLDFINDCSSVPDTHKMYWTSSFNLLCAKCNGECLVLLLPALEHSLRCAFCSLNDCPERIRVAEQSTLYTTLDEVLDQHYLTSEGIAKENQLPTFLGTSIMEMLMDVFHSYEGPRIRDKLSHGECHVEQIPHVVANHVFWLGLLILTRLECSTNEELCATLKHVESTYSAKFHSISKLRFEVKEVMKKLEKLPTQSDAQQNHNLLDDILQLDSFLLQYSFKFCEGEDHRNSLEKQIIHLSNKQLSTLFRTKSDLTMIVSLRKIMSAVSQICDNCCIMVASRQNSLSQHELRSRQRASYFRMLNFLPCLQAILKSITLIVIIQAVALPDVFGRPRFMKKVQHYTENVASLSRLQKNRWEEIKGLSTGLCKSFLLELNI